MDVYKLIQRYWTPRFFWLLIPLSMAYVTISYNLNYVGWVIVVFLSIPGIKEIIYFMLFVPILKKMERMSIEERNEYLRRFDDETRQEINEQFNKRFT